MCEALSPSPLAPFPKSLFSPVLYNLVRVYASVEGWGLAPGQGKERAGLCVFGREKEGDSLGHLPEKQQQQVNTCKIEDERMTATFVT